MTGYTTRAEHMAKCRWRALACFDDGLPGSALVQLVGDLKCHPETADRCPHAEIVWTLWDRRRITDARVRAYLEGMR
jgi:hypothetical protein